jgi:hypothetical protein
MPNEDITLNDVARELSDSLARLSANCAANTNWSHAYVTLFGPETKYLKFLASRPSAEAIETINDSVVMTECQALLAKLRGPKRRQPEEKTMVITVRLPAGVHDTLRHEAYTHRTSLNKLCLSKLLAPVEPVAVVSGATGKLDTSSVAVPTR